jgi:hypothetical protein
VTRALPERRVADSRSARDLAPGGPVRAPRPPAIAAARRLGVVRRRAGAARPSRRRPAGRRVSAAASPVIVFHGDANADAVTPLAAVLWSPRRSRPGAPSRWSRRVACLARAIRAVALPGAQRPGALRRGAAPATSDWLVRRGGRSRTTRPTCAPRPASRRRRPRVATLRARSADVRAGPPRRDGRRGERRRSDSPAARAIVTTSLDLSSSASVALHTGGRSRVHAIAEAAPRRPRRARRAVHPGSPDIAGVPRVDRRRDATLLR